jgi:hypothetical protein
MNDRTHDEFDLDQLLHPAQAFGHPSEVTNDPDLTLNEKHAILAAWASDACAMESAPALRNSPNGEGLVPFDEIMDALRALDKQTAEQLGAARYRRLMRRRRRFECRSSRSRSEGRTLN